jgi:hypothetical protein
MKTLRDHVRALQVISAEVECWSLNFRKQAAGFPDQLMQLSPLGKRLAGVQPVLLGILVAAWRT